jgi:hypothetical protein
MDSKRYPSAHSRKWHSWSGLPRYYARTLSNPTAQRNPDRVMSYLDTSKDASAPGTKRRDAVEAAIRAVHEYRTCARTDKTDRWAEVVKAVERVLETP